METKHTTPLEIRNTTVQPSKFSSDVERKTLNINLSRCHRIGNSNVHRSRSDTALFFSAKIKDILLGGIRDDPVEMKFLVIHFARMCNFIVSLTTQIKVCGECPRWRQQQRFPSEEIQELCERYITKVLTKLTCSQHSVHFFLLYTLSTCAPMFSTLVHYFLLSTLSTCTPKWVPKRISSKECLIRTYNGICFPGLPKGTTQFT